MFEWDQRDRTARAFERAMTLNPSSAQGAPWYYLFYLAFAAAETEAGYDGMRKLHERDPLSPYLCAMLSILAASLRRPEAGEWASRALVLDPDAFLSIFSSQIAAAATGDWPRTIAASESLFAVGGRTSAPLSWYAQALHRNGDLAGARVVYDELQRLTNHGERAPFTLACVAAEIGLNDDAAAFTRQAIARRDPTVYAYGRGLLTPVEALRQLPVYEEAERQMNWPASVYRYPG